MDTFSFKEPVPQFKNPEEEVAFLRRQLNLKEQEIRESGETQVSQEHIANQTINAYKGMNTEEVLHEDVQMSPKEQDHITLRLNPESHDAQIEELFGILLEKGLKNTLDIVSSMGSPHLEDDFHRFLVQYLVATHEIPGLQSLSSESRSLNLSLFEITLPVDSITPDANTLSAEALMRAMEQFYAGMQAIAVGENNKEKQYYTIEIAKPIGAEYVVLYVSLPKERGSLLEKHLLAYYKDAKVREITDDYNIFVDGAESVASYASLKEREVLPILTYDELGHDPMSVLLNVFSKLDAKQEGAAIQIVVTPLGEDTRKEFGKVLDDLKKGTKLKEAGYGTFGKDLFKTGKDLFVTSNKDKEDEEKKMDDFAIDGVTKKLSSTLFTTSIRLVSSSMTKTRSESILHDVESAFHQFTRPHGNSFVFTPVPEKRHNQLLHNFIFRIPSAKHSLVLNSKELTSIFHFPVGHAATMGIKESRSGTAPAPFEAREGSVAIGANEYRGDVTDVYMKEIDRMRHLYVIGQTGTGKTGILLNMIAQDIKNGEGVCYIDPHGNDIQTLLSMIPKERAEDVIYFDPAYTERPFGLNMLEYDPRFPEQKTFVINELMNIFNQLFDMKTTGGPMFEQYFKNSAGLVMDHPESGSTLLEITRVLSDKAFREMKLQHTTNPIIKQFWLNAEKTTGDQGLENFVPYITSKFDTFISNEVMRPIVAQQHSSFNFRDIMDKKKILLVNLSKGRLGEINANLIGMLIVGKLQMAALSRVDSFGKEYPPFYLYIDEFQNVTTPSISSILSEARKYKLSLTVAHQYLSQLGEDIKGAILGNVGSMALFRISPEDALALEGRFKPTFSADDIIKLDNRNAIVSMLVNGQPSKPFNVKTHDYMPGNKDIIEPLKQLSYMSFGRPRAEVESEIMERFHQGQKS
jgi:hypothetical protein